MSYDQDFKHRILLLSSWLTLSIHGSVGTRQSPVEITATDGIAKRFLGAVKQLHLFDRAAVFFAHLRLLTEDKTKATLEHIIALIKAL